MSDWLPIETLPPWDERPGTMFVRLEGYKTHGGAAWSRVGWGIASITKDGRFGFYTDDIAHIVQRSDMDYDDCKVTHWAPLQQPNLPISGSGGDV